MKKYLMLLVKIIAFITFPLWILFFVFFVTPFLIIKFFWKEISDLIDEIFGENKK